MRTHLHIYIHKHNPPEGGQDFSISIFLAGEEGSDIFFLKFVLPLTQPGCIKVFRVGKVAGGGERK